MTKTLYVGNLPWSATEEQIMAAFSQHGKVESCRVVTDRETGRSRGFGFVEVADEDSAKILQAMNGADFSGRALVVEEAKPRRSRF
ncbi:MAG: RNA-binding protein [Acetobacteraceae bacterium]|nr:RNA-binding protein [Acetobacteraceae bacterium]